MKKKLLEQVDFTEEYPKIHLEQGDIQLRKLPSYITHSTRSQTIDGDNEIRNRTSLIKYIYKYKQQVCDKMEEELKACMNQDSIANASGVLNILSLPAVYEETECFEHSYGRKDIDVLAKHFGNEHWVLRSFKDDSSENRFIINTRSS